MDKNWFYPPPKQRIIYEEEPPAPEETGGVGTDVLVAIVMPCFLGAALQKLFHLPDWMAICLVFVTIALAIAGLIREQRLAVRSKAVRK